jgi:pentatricopeptide repeat protein
VRQNALSNAIECYESSRRAGHAFDVATNRTLLKACVASNDMMQAELLFQHLVSSGRSPDFAVFSAMIRGHHSAGHSSEALSYLELMKKHGVQPDSSLFDVVLESCIWQDAPALVEQVLADMESNGISPTSNTLASILQLYGNSCKFDRVLEAFEDMPRRHGIKVDSRAYTAMISSCLTNGRLDLALETFDRMSRAGCQTKARIYDALLVGCIRRGDLDRAVRLVDDALGFSSSQGGSDSRPTEEEQPAELPPPPQPRQPPRARLEQTSVESLLRLIGKRGQAARLGVPLLKRLRGATTSFQVPSDIESAILRQAESDGGNNSILESRLEAHRWWRDFRRMPESAMHK